MTNLGIANRIGGTGFTRGARHGQPAGVVRWVRTVTGGWSFELVEGVAAGHSRNAYRLLVDGVLREFPRGEGWDACLA